MFEWYLFEKEHINLEEYELMDSKINNGICYDVDETKRKSKESITRIDMSFDCHELKKWILLKYERGSFFTKHTDKNLGTRIVNGVTQTHIGSILIFPPKKMYYYSGGQLIIYYDDEIHKITSHNDKWTCVMFSLDIKHEVKEIMDGTRYVFKGFLYI
jgi:hypothetical protein